MTDLMVELEDELAAELDETIKRDEQGVGGKRHGLGCCG